MGFWEFLITEMIWHLVFIGMGMLIISVLANFYFERTFHRPLIQKVLNVTSNFLAVTATLVFITALIASVIENMQLYNWIILGFIVISLIVSVKVYKGD
ncbi:hypothetical protein BN85313630 [Paracholeplasma brassicae]|uniref:Uncharacterized protein n=1 Tax=Acholeplasma brassicae TaxID=61635 RepID=U4KTB2_9MOLU|nr:hypothetical protein [Paracholeplasma brassicae]CCV66384.1 hypothetical protein BN85313630 [Paracholeplasma brassicae]